jgi:hypothetical protein
MSWDNRIFRYKNGELGIHEVFYDEEDDKISWTLDAVGCYGNDLEDLREGLRLKMLALDKPILDYEEEGDE